MAFQQALNTILSVLLAAWFAEWADAKLGTGGEQIATIQLALTVVVGGVLSFAFELLRAVVLDFIPVGRFPRLYKLLGGTLLALVLVGCQIPTSSRGSVADGAVEGQGGTIACASGFTSTLGDDGTLTSVGCAGAITWTDPPSESETGGLFGSLREGLTGLLALPARMIGGMAAGVQGAQGAQ